MSEERRLVVLRAIVQDYVSTSEPVASKALLERHRLGVSAATIRNDMAALEDAGLITAPHTSAGRVPTDAGYRLFVDRLGEIRPLTSAQRVAIARFLEGAVDLDDVVDRTVRLLSSLTQQVAMVQYPSLSRSRVQHIELVPVAAGRVMVVLILTTGRVEQRIIAVDRDLTSIEGASLLADIRARLNTEARDVPLVDVATRLVGLPEGLPEEDRELVRTIVDALTGALVEESEERVVLAGRSNLARFGRDFPLSIVPVLSALEEHVVLLRLFGSLAEEPDSGELAVTIGHENPHADLAETSVISAGYGAGDDVVGGLAVLGPTRMDYPRTMAAVRAVARYVSEMLAP